MLYDLRTYTLKAGTGAGFLKRFEAALPYRESIAASKLGGFFQTEFGRLNQFVFIWLYDDFAHYEQVRTVIAADSSGKWPPDLRGIVVERESALLTPAPFMREWTGPQQLGGAYELRICTHEQGALGEIYRLWGEALSAREQLSPLVGAWSGESGPLNTFYHLWAYESLDERKRVRATAAGDPKYKWPPATSPLMVRQESKVLIPVSFSPLQ